MIIGDCVWKAAFDVLAGSADVAVDEPEEGKVAGLLELGAMLPPVAPEDPVA